MKNKQAIKIQLWASWVALVTLLSAPMYLQAEVYSTDPNATDVFVYHHNGALACQNGSYCRFYFDNGQIAWRGATYADSSYYEHNRKTYHANGQIAWRGASYGEASLLNHDRKGYHSNGSLAWRGASYEDEPMYEHDRKVYHANGQLAWRGGNYKHDSIYHDERKVYHANGAVAWRGATYPEDNRYSYESKLYYSNGQMAWNGQAGAELYDDSGRIMESSVDSLMLSLGEGSWLYVSSQGYRDLYLSIGEGSHLIFSYDYRSPDREEIKLGLHLGEEYDLYFHLHDEDKRVYLITDNQRFEVK